MLLISDAIRPSVEPICATRFRRNAWDTGNYIAGHAITYLQQNLSAVNTQYFYLLCHTQKCPSYEGTKRDAS